ncbi:hypothetical protein OOK13_43790 [Streptomyces sp. NBC_00378]|uniref:hypothetical protein n=1 Tax=unclassified Streptomyces TaxID=2593676 RepID=UPI002250AF8B|nr:MULTISPECIES: hypothetical protein [unclassified Streptomyces]MCX5115251.1 hypothetical protein [Streptomyces sp. NBC_00378]
MRFDLKKAAREAQIRSLENPFVREVAEYLLHHAHRLVTNKEIKKALNMSDTHTSAALNGAASRGVARKIGHGLWQAN